MKQVTIHRGLMLSLAVAFAATSLFAQERFLGGSLRPAANSGIAPAQRAFEAAAFGKSAQRILLHGHHWNIKKAQFERGERGMSIGGILTNDRSNNFDRHRQYQIDLANNGTITAIRVGEQGAIRQAFIEPGVTRAFLNFYQRQPVPASSVNVLALNLQKLNGNSSWEFAAQSVVAQIAIRASALFRNHIANRMDVLATAARSNRPEKVSAYGYPVEILQASGGQRRGSTLVYSVTLRVNGAPRSTTFLMQLLVNKPEKFNVNARIDRLEYSVNGGRTYFTLSGEVMQNIERYIGPDANFIRSRRIRTAIGQRIDEISGNDVSTVGQKVLANLALRLMRMEPN